MRHFVLNEPRGGDFRHVNLLVPAKDPRAQAAFIIMEPEDIPPMWGSNSICVATVLLDGGLVPMQEPATRARPRGPGGLMRVRAECRDGKAERIFVQKLPSFAARLGVPLEVKGIGTLTLDTAYGGDSFVLVDPAALGLSLTADEAHDIACLGVGITAAATEALGFHPPGVPGLEAYISFGLFAGALERRADGLRARRPWRSAGKVDRSPTGTALSARMAVLHARGEIAEGETLTAGSLIGSTSPARILGTTTVRGQAAILPEISGPGWITGIHSKCTTPPIRGPRATACPTLGVRVAVPDDGRGGHIRDLPSLELRRSPKAHSDDPAL